MLKLVYGRCGYGKTEYVFNCIKKAYENGCRDILLLAPEQFSFSSERRLLKDLGPAGMSCVENSSFTRLSNQVKSVIGAPALPTLSKGGKLVLMMQAINNVRDSLELFDRKIDTLNFVGSMINVYDEMKSCNLDSYQVSALSQNIENEILTRKMHDIALIMSSYEALISDRFLDSADELTRIYNQIKDIGFFKNKTIFIDGFNGFVAQEYKILELIISEGAEVVITLCCDDFDNENSLFSYVNNSAKIIQKIAAKANVETKIISLKENHRAKSRELLAVERYVLSDKIDNCIPTEGAIDIFKAKNISDECIYASIKIKQLLRSGYKASDIAIIVRDLEAYRDELAYCFRKYEVPFFDDERQPVKSQPLVVFIEYLLRCVTNSLRSEDIISLAKTGLTSATDSEINLLENYIYTWSINGSRWTKDFTNSTKGFTEVITENDQKRLDKINQTRKKLVGPVLKFKGSVKGNTAKGICEAIYNTLIEMGVDKKIREQAKFLSGIDKHALAQMQGRVWDIVMDILNQLAMTLGDKKIKLNEFANIFSLVIANEDLGILPSGIDNVQIGQADRIRTDNPRAVILLGANQEDFPKSVIGGGLISESERKILLENDFKLYSYSDILNKQEAYFAYIACSCASERLFISYHGNKGKEAAPSEIITSIETAISNINEYTYNDFDYIELVETNTNAFELMCQNYLVNEKFFSSLKKYFEDDSRLSAIDTIALNKPVAIKSTKNATELFNYNIYASASRIEDYFNCPFRYFCKYGLNAKPAQKAEMDYMQKGTIIHYVLEKLLFDYGTKALSSMEKSVITDIIDKYIQEYFTQKLGDVSDINQRFTYNFKRMSRLIYGVVFRLADEFKSCQFEARAFELDIDKDGSVKPEFLQLDDGGTIRIRGSIDRVDTYTKDGEQYVRVIDYKSGTKSFNLSDVMYGINLQMLIYLFSVCEDKTSEYSGIPAGVLYMHAKRDLISFDTKTEEESQLSKKEADMFKMKGIVVCEDETIPTAMEENLEGKYIPVKLTKKGLSGDFANLEQIGLIHKKINKLIKDMGLSLHQGRIERHPFSNKNHTKTCEYCDYRDVCVNQKIIEERVAPDLTAEEVSELLKKEFEADA